MYEYLDSLPGSLSEHIRRAIDEYIEKMKSPRASISPSKRKEENNNG
jgi:hypothetical protein